MEPVLKKADLYPKTGGFHCWLVFFSSGPALGPFPFPAKATWVRLSFLLLLCLFQGYFNWYFPSRIGMKPTIGDGILQERCLTLWQDLFYFSILRSPSLSFLLSLPFFMSKDFATFGFAFDLKKYGSEGCGRILASGALSVIFTLMILFNPTLGGLTIGFLQHFYFFSLGLFNITHAFALKKIREKGGDAKALLQNLKNKIS